MSSQAYESIARYFRRLGLAVIGKDYTYNDVYVNMNGRVEKAEADLMRLKEMYDVALDKWKSNGELAKKLFGERTEMKEQIASYQILVETLRSTIRDKQAMIDAYAQAEQKQNNTVSK